jgi:hypothetical protein
MEDLGGGEELGLGPLERLATCGDLARTDVLLSGQQERASGRQVTADLPQVPGGEGADDNDEGNDEGGEQPPNGDAGNA